MDREHNARSAEDAKGHGCYYTPDPVARSLVRWVVRRQDDQLLDPSRGNGRFIEMHARNVGIEQHQ